MFCSDVPDGLFEFICLFAATSPTQQARPRTLPLQLDQKVTLNLPVFPKPLELRICHLYLVMENLPTDQRKPVTCICFYIVDETDMLLA